MLVLTRKINEEIIIGDDIKITVISIKDGKVRIGIDAPLNVIVDRTEVRKKKNTSEQPKIIPISSNG